METKKHWETIYTNKLPHEVSWTQEVPKTSLDFMHSFQLSKDARIIDIGGGDSKLVDHLLEEGYTNLTVLDISGEALNRAKMRLGAKAGKVKWIECDILRFKPTESYDVWHDRAAFHFLTKSSEISSYLSIAAKAVEKNKYVITGTFSTQGPIKCSGLEIKQYDERSLAVAFEDKFEKIRCLTENHVTPFNTLQNFTFCSFKRSSK